MVSAFYNYHELHDIKNARLEIIMLYWVMNSLGDKICLPAAPSIPVNKIE